MVEICATTSFATRTIALRGTRVRPPSKELPVLLRHLVLYGFDLLDRGSHPAQETQVSRHSVRSSFAAARFSSATMKSSSLKLQRASSRPRDPCPCRPLREWQCGLRYLQACPSVRRNPNRWRSRPSRSGGPVAHPRHDQPATAGNEVMPDFMGRIDFVLGWHNPRPSNWSWLNFSTPRPGRR